MSKIMTLNDVENKNILDDIFDGEITVYEDIQGSKIWVNWDGNQFIIKPKSVNNEPLNLIDLAIQNYYNPAINYFNSLSDRVKSLMPKKWYFCFEYFPDEMPGNIRYQRIPKNGLVITSIWKSGKYENNYEELDEWSRLFDVDGVPIIFSGVLSDGAKEAIKYFLNTSEGDLEYVFGEKSFSFFFYKLLNPQTSGSFLMEDNFQDNLEKIIITGRGGKSNFEILNPLYQRISQGNSTEFSDVYSLILLNFMTFCQSVNLEDLKIKGESREEMYIYLISKIFNIYISSVGDDLENFEFTIPSFFNQDKFKINKELISNKTTKAIIEKSEKMEYIFKVILGSFSKKKKRLIGIFTDSTLNLFNSYVDKIGILIDNQLGKIREIQINQQNLLDFSDFFEIKYDVDGDKQVYPDVYDEILSGREKEKKGKKSDKFGFKK